MDFFDGGIVGRGQSKIRRKGKALQSSSAPRSKRVLNVVLMLALVGLVGGIIWSQSRQRTPAMSDTAPVLQVISVSTPTTTKLHTTFTAEPKTLNELLALPVERLGEVDIARMNLLCATGLPGAEKLDIDHALATLDEWVKRVQFETDRHLYRVHDPKWADHYQRSEARLRAEMLLQVLQEDLGVKYDMSAEGNFSFKDSRVAFIHGMIPSPGQTTRDTSGGTCASMPVMYVAVGRRLGYPLKLVTTDAHIFARWDGLASGSHPNVKWRERFNVDGAGHGFSSFEDDYYLTWPHKVTRQQAKVNGYLLSLSPAEEFAQFLAARGHCGIDNNQNAFAARCYENAYRYDTTRPCYRSWFMKAALPGNYRPTTPILAQLLQQKHQAQIAMARPSLDGMQMPSQMVMDLPNTPHASTLHGFTRPQPATPGVPQQATPFAQYQPPTPPDPHRRKP